ncbi:GAF domain-containing protein [Actinoplanes palleronii]|uniref:GAF domain-containing protein n=1 Tax=Actinoplanes palleronii TaxID=113570 RepID=A0ABQ4BQS3_9ACTN|nr:GAF domain-containing protein [Actinoplanes palleronii]GIE72656.1 hypothetical protein Apa02nite_087640 [Actinoplanes palleronii]
MTDRTPHRSVITVATPARTHRADTSAERGPAPGHTYSGSPVSAGQLPSAEFPARQAPAPSFPGVPIQIGAPASGSPYPAGNADAETFPADDEELVTVLAAVAGGATALLHESRRRQQWQAAMTELSTAVLGNDDPVGFALPQIVVHATSASSAAGVCVCVPAGQPDMLLVAAGGGVYTDSIGTTFSTAGSVYADALADRRPAVVADWYARPRADGQLLDGVGPAVALPMRNDAAVTGVLFVCNQRAAPRFDALDLELFGGYARHAALVMQLALARHDNVQLRLSDDRQQIGDDLHHHVLHRVSQLGIDLHGIAARLHDSTAQATIMTAIDDTDTIIRELRSAIFSLHRLEPARPGAIRHPPAAE